MLPVAERWMPVGKFHSTYYIMSRMLIRLLPPPLLGAGETE